MLRAARFAAKMNFDIEPQTAAPIPELASLLDNIPSARLFDEFGKMFQAGAALATWHQLRALGLLEHLFPWTAEWLAAAPDDESDSKDKRTKFIEAALRGTDERVKQEKPVTPMFLFAVFLWGPVRERADYYIQHEQMSDAQALVIASDEMAVTQNSRIAVPKRFSYPMREIMRMQPRFEKRRGKRAESLLAHRRFRAAYDLLLLRVELGEVDPELAQWWTDIQELPEYKKTEKLAAGKPHGKPRRRKRSGNRQQ
jgi:poly(A) polymerase